MLLGLAYYAEGFCHAGLIRYGVAHWRRFSAILVDGDDGDDDGDEQSVA